jgi:hypothetical protein
LNTEAVTVNVACGSSNSATAAGHGERVGACRCRGGGGDSQ